MEKQIIWLGIIIALGIVGSSILFTTSDTTFQEVEKYQVKKFSTYEELEDYIEKGSEYYSVYSGIDTWAVRTTGIAEPMVDAVQAGVAESALKGSGEEGLDYSTTNIQVEGVDEADIVKNDGKYIYTVSGSSVFIVDAYPAEDAEILSEINLDNIHEIFVNEDKLVIFGNEDYKNTLIRVYDISDREDPELEREVSVNGSYFESRMIGDYVYAIVNQPIYRYGGGPVPLPAIREDNVKIAIPVSEIYYFDYPDRSYIYTNILAINTQDEDEELSIKTYLMSYSQSMYASINNIYVVYTKRYDTSRFYDKIIDEVFIPSVPSSIRDDIEEIRDSDKSEWEKLREIGEIIEEHIDSLDPEEGAEFMQEMEEKMQDLYTEIAKEMEKTVIHKISIDEEDIDYEVSGEVPGQVLNQFSMDENKGYFRIATTVSRNWRTGSESLNNMYILDDDLDITGKVEDLAKGEMIYSVRFIGDKGYMVTFRQVDPLYVIDLEDPYNPRVLGYLKIPGVSDYLHPYDETHLIGVGRDATEEGRMLGMKLSLFDVSDVSEPEEIDSYIIGERGTYSEALNDHKAFLFDRSKNLLVLPIQLSEENKWRAWEGAYVFSLNLVDGFELKGRVTHSNETKEDEYHYDYGSQIRRSLYIDNILYTISNKMIKMNDLDDLDEINEVDLPYEEQIYYRYGGIVEELVSE
ncbi:MAG: beta-propeller domain-containing protein [Candidatus Woesearchaeota archaeon]|nr:MAG: beta-propeller domain-containing protein [Candidatus Woesearchaeota archaeon]